jgi:hypothetical protein
MLSKSYLVMTSLFLVYIKLILSNLLLVVDVVEVVANDGKIIFAAHNITNF